MTTTPEPAADYIARLVDSRKRAYALDCLACWNQSQPFASEWPNLKAELVADVAAKMRRYLKAKPQSAQAVKPEPSPVAEWVETVTNPEPAKANPQQTGQPEIIVCPECSQAIRTSEIINGKCPNPACFVGLAAYHAAYRSWSSAHDAYSKAARMAGQPYAGNSWLTRNPEPKPDDFRNGKQPKYPEWEKPHFETREEREARLEAEKWANPTIITRKHGTSRILASVPEQQRFKLEAEIAKAETARIPDHRTYLRGKAYIGPVRGSVYDGRLVFTETLGGEKWAGAFARMFEVAGIVGWNKKDGAKPGDYIPATPAEARHIQAVAGSTFAEAAG